MFSRKGLSVPADNGRFKKIFINFSDFPMASLRKILYTRSGRKKERNIYGQWSCPWRAKHRERGKIYRMNRGNWKEDTWREPKKKQRRRQRKMVLQFLSVGMLMFFAGLYVGTVYAQTAGEQELKAAGIQKNTPQVTEGSSSQVGSAGPARIAAAFDENIQEDETEDMEAEEEQEENLPDDWNLLLVNADHALPEDFSVELGSIGGGHKLDIRIVEDFKEMIRAAKKERVTIYVSSSYRSLEKQVELHQNKIEEYVMAGYPYQEAQEKAATVVAIPGTSEHQLGLAVDLVSSEYRNLDEKQENTKGFQWLKEHCSEYGFILRYPNGRTNVTGIIYEPWHFRYVGKEAAKEITERGITLEEYLGAKPVFGEEAEWCETDGEKTDEQERDKSETTGNEVDVPDRTGEKIAGKEANEQNTEEKETPGKDS